MLTLFWIIPSNADGGEEWATFVWATQARAACRFAYQHRNGDDVPVPSFKRTEKQTTVANEAWTAFIVPTDQPQAPGALDWSTMKRTDWVRA